MAIEKSLKPDYIFETSWEVCNKVGGIYTVLSTRAKTLENEWGNRLIFIGPDVVKGTSENPDFIEDKNIFKAWKEHATDEGLKIKIGRWNIPGNPIAILVDFTPLFVDKNEIFTELWVKYKLDSLTGQWDYIEPALFGYAAGKVIECFYHYHLNYTDQIIAQFHEWMTGAGILYLEENAPQIATIFTTHATVVGRCIAGNGMPFYSRFDTYNANQVARDFNVVSKHSLEKISAYNADCFTTVSEITARECEKFLEKEPDIITRNGFDASIVPVGPLFLEKRAFARQKLFSVAEALLNQALPKDSLLVMKSGRYEFRNKGIDVFIESLAQLRDNPSLDKDIIAFIFVPAHQTGPRKELLDRLNKPDYSKPVTGEVLTHNLQGAESDPIMNKINEMGLDNASGGKVKIIFVPTYLDGNDGIFNLPYYDALIGFDLAVFPSYYEPWGYTPLESIAFHIPAITTSVSGFGMAVEAVSGHQDKGVYVIERNDTNDDEVVHGIADIIFNFSGKPETEIEQLRDAACNLSKSFDWSLLIEQYKEAYHFALKRSLRREDLFRNKPQAEPLIGMEMASKAQPVWRSLSIKYELPESLAPLQRLSDNLWWSWNEEATAIFRDIDPNDWEVCCHNPVLLLRNLSFDKIKKLEEDTAFIERLAAVETGFNTYMAAKPGADDKPAIAYFCMEYGLNSYLKIYSGGLGILAGDYLKEASDSNVNFIAVGLLYKNGYFKQRLSLHGEQLAENDRLKFANLPLNVVRGENGLPLKINLAFPGRTVCARIWRIDVGRVPLYLMDTNVNENNDEDKAITSKLYGGDQETRLKQELLLGIGGIRMMEALGLKADIYHCNEGHAAFIGLERLHNLIIQENLSFNEALEVVRASTLFTTHTSIPAANDIFTEDMLRPYLAHHAQSFNIDWEVLMGLGRADETNHGEKFSMTYLASRLSQEINAVSKLHKTVSCRLLNNLWPDYRPEELHIGYVTNAVHYNTWVAWRWQLMYKGTFDIVDSKGLADKSRWERIYKVPDRTIWDIRSELKQNLLAALRKKLNDDLAERHQNPGKILQIINNLNENALIIGFARRFVTYKRSDMLFFDTERLYNMLSNAKRPVQIIFSGKAHPQDAASMDLIKHVVNITERPEFEGKIMFLEDYDMDIARLLVQGVDLWLNTPVRQMEASGTSGMKAALNGVLNLSVLDGWWYEAYREDSGWALNADATYQRQDFQDELDAETIYGILENEIIPLYFNRNEDGLPVKWIKRIKNMIANVAPDYVMGRMLSDYQSRFYNKMYKRVNELKAENFGLAKNIAAWKREMMSHWDEIEILSIDIENEATAFRASGEEFKAKIEINPGPLSVNDIGIEVIFMEQHPNAGLIDSETVTTHEFEITKTEGQNATYECKVSLTRSGAYEYSFRMFPKNAALPNRQDFSLVDWV